MKFGIIGQANITIEMFPTEEEMATKNPAKAVMKRLQQGAPETKFFPITE